MVAEEDALALIADIEVAERKKVEYLNQEENLDGDIMMWWQKRFPQVPTRVFRYMSETPDNSSSPLPWNRSVRRRLQQSKKILLHLYAGEKAEEWKELEAHGWDVITLDITKGKDQDVHGPKLWGFLTELARKGAIKCVVGGPPCRTVSRMRFKRPGPRPLRDRGEGRFGLPHLSAGEQRLADHDTALVLKQLGIFYMAEEARLRHGLGEEPTGFLLESPEDPGKNKLRSMMPSFWSWEELQDLASEEGMNVINFDQRPMGHCRKKPTSILTNLPNMLELQELRSPTGQDEPLVDNLSERMEQSRSWALWAPGFPAAVWASLKIYMAKLLQQAPRIAKALTGREKELWTQHFRQGHTPFRRDCRLCVEQMGAQRPHRRRKEGQTMTSSWSMSVDIVGPLPRAKDLATSHYMKYALVAVALVPDFGQDKKETMDDQEALEHEEGRTEEREQPEEGPHPREDEEPGEVDLEKEETPEEEQFQKELEESLKSVPVKHVVHVEPIASRAQDEVVTAMQKALAGFKAMGVYINRLHSDRAKELISKPMTAWCARNGIVPTTTAGDDPASNGHAESEVHQLKRKVRLHLAEKECDVTSWPDAFRYAAMERRYKQLEALGVPCLPMLPYRGRVLVKVKKWHKGGGLVAPFADAVILCPSHLVNGGWVVQLKDDRVLHVREAVQTNEEGEQLRIQEGPRGEVVKLQLEEDDRPGQPHRRMTGKQPLGDTPCLKGTPNKGTVPLPAGGEYSSSSTTILRPSTSTSELWKDSPEKFPRSSTAASAAGVRTMKVEPAGRTVEQEMGDQGRWLDMDQVKDTWEWQHRMLQKQLSNLVDDVPRNATQGAQSGLEVEWFVDWRDDLEDNLIRLGRVERDTRVHLCSLQAQEPDILQTITVPLHEVRDHPQDWIPAFQYEYNVLVHDTQAVHPLPREELPEGTELIPGKMVCVRKGGSGQHRARAVICGNMASPTADPSWGPAGSYASGADGTLIRCAVRQAAHEGWQVSALDVKSAFLQAARPVAPGANPVAVVPPRLMSQLGICPDNEVWVVKKALYGFQTSPSHWALHRDERFSTFAWECQGEKFMLQPTKERNLWRIVKEGDKRPVGLMLVYVDDLLVMGTWKAHDGLVSRIQQEWKTSKPEKVNKEDWVRFCGFEMKTQEENILVGQPSYLQDLLRRRGVTTKRSTPLPKEHLAAMEVEEEIKIEDVRQAQAIAGEILWMSVRSRPDLSYAIGALGREVTKHPRWAVQTGHYILEYLNATADCFLAYGRCRDKDRGPDDALARERSMNLVEIYCDVSYAPQGEKSIQGIVGMVP